MSNKNPLNEVALTTTENLAKGLLITSTTSLIEDFAKAVPFATTAIALTQAYSNFKSAQSQRQLLTFIQEVENINHGFIEKFFQNKDNTQIGLEVLGILDQTYLEKQAKMIGRIALLKSNNKILKKDFYKYAHIVTRLNNYLIDEIESLYREGNSFKGLMELPVEDPNLEDHSRLSHPNLDLVSFGFLKEYADDDKPFWNSETIRSLS